MATTVGRTILGLSLAATGVGPAILGATAAAQGVDEIVVTAQRREQNIQDVGVSVAALSADALRDLGVSGSKDIGAVIPGVTFDGTAGGNQSVSLGIRGVVQSDYSVNQEAPNSLYLDDVYISSPSELSFPVYDLDRVEVLRGPQGTLFGRSSSGGLAHFVTKRPTEDFNAYAEGGAGEFNTYYAEAAVGGPFSDRVRGRLSGRYDKGDGWFENTAPGGEDAFEKDFRGFRGQLEGDLTDSLVARLSVSYDKMPKHNEGVYKAFSSYALPNGDSALLPPDLVNPAYDGFEGPFGIPGPGEDFYGFRDAVSDKQSGAFNNIGFFGMQRTAPTLYLVLTTDAFTLTSISNYTKFESRYQEDCDGSDVNVCVYPLDQDLKQYSQEVRLNGTADELTWTTGVYFLRTDQSFFQGFRQPALSGGDFAFASDNPGKQDLNSYAAFGQIEYLFTDQWRGTFGLRYTRDEKEFDSQVLFLELGPFYEGDGVLDPPLLAYDFRKGADGVGDLYKVSDNMISGKLQIDYIASDDALLYAGISRGVKGPGFNSNNSAAISIEDTPFDSESVMAYEVGAKLTGFDDRVRLNTGVFYYDYKDFQAFQYVGLSGKVSNNDATFSGLEVELATAPMDGLNINLGVAYLFTSEVKDVLTAGRGVLDQDASNAPDLSVTGLISKSFDIGPGELAVQWNFNYVGDRFASTDNTGGNRLASSLVHNARLSYELPSEWEIAAYVSNLSDEDRENFVFDFTPNTGQLLRSYAPPRMWGVSVRKDF